MQENSFKSPLKYLLELNLFIFRLGYFERKHNFYNQSQLTVEIGRHYSQQVCILLNHLSVGIKKWIILYDSIYN